MAKQGLLTWLRSGLSASGSGSGKDAHEARVGAGNVETHLLRRFEDLGEVAAGGTGSIRKVLDKNLLRTVAMKVLDPQIAGHKDGLQRFHEEAQITSQLEHPGIVPIHDYGVDEEGTHYITMKLVRGQTLTDLMEAEGGPSRDGATLRRHLEVFLRICEAVGFAHSKGVLHRDLKPDNIMVGAFGQVFVMDWGLALVPGASDETHQSTAVQLGRAASGEDIDHDGNVVGTLQFMAPEQALGRVSEIDDRTDVFGLGALLYYVLCGFPPYHAEYTIDLLRMAQTARVPPPAKRMDGVPTGLSQIAMRALALAKDERYQAATDLADDVKRFLNGGMHFPQTRFAAGDIIVREGDEGEEAFIIVEGNCVVSRDRGGESVTVADIGPGDVFGEASVFSAEVRTATVTARTDVTAMVVDKATLAAELGFDTWSGQFVQSLAQRFVTVNAKVREYEDNAR